VVLCFPDGQGSASILVCHTGRYHPTSSTASLKFGGADCVLGTKGKGYECRVWSCSRYL